MFERKIIKHILDSTLPIFPFCENNLCILITCNLRIRTVFKVFLAMVHKKYFSCFVQSNYLHLSLKND